MELLSAFAGAFFAFVFIKLSEYLTIYRSNANKHYSSLIRMQYIINIHLDEIQLSKATSRSKVF
jgi:hypothetical protein